MTLRRLAFRLSVDINLAEKIHRSSSSYLALMMCGRLVCVAQQLLTVHSSKSLSLCSVLAANDFLQTRNRPLLAHA